MSISEELIQRGYIQNGKLFGESFGKYSYLDLGSTTAKSLEAVGLVQHIPDRKDISFPFAQYKCPKPQSCKPDRVFYLDIDGEYEAVATGEFKKPTELNTEKKLQKAREQALYAGIVMSVGLAVVTDGDLYEYIDVQKSVKKKAIVFIKEHRSLTGGVLCDLIGTGKRTANDLNILAEKSWQAIWHATKEEPKECLMTFVEIFVLKFLSDNFSKLPKACSFYELAGKSEADFFKMYGKTQIEYYVQTIRPKIKEIFSEKVVVSPEVSKDILGIETLVSNTSVINGFAFLHSGETSVETFNRTFLEILSYFNEFGSLSDIDPEFKLRLYETFLKKSARQQKLGQFFTPRNVVKSIVKMAELAKLDEGSLVMDPAGGVGGFLLEPLIEEDALLGNITLSGGKYTQKVRVLGLDVDERTNVLAKANTLIHFAEHVRSETVHPQALNQLMADMFIVMNENRHLGTLFQPIEEKVDVIITNPPYVTKGSAIYKNEIDEKGGVKNGIALKDHYSRCGLGLEGLFLRYISGALKPGGKAFVIVPQGMLTRTESTLRKTIHDECNILASISLPPNTFFNTPQKTYILVLQKRYTKADPRPDIFCAIASSIGETLDERRVPKPADNNLSDIADEYIRYANEEGDVANGRIKIVDHEQLGVSDRWDVTRFWSEEELVDLGAKEAAISRSNFLEQAEKDLFEITEDMRQVKDDIEKLTSCEKRTYLISDEERFATRKGHRITRDEGDENPGDIPVYSGRKNPNNPLTRVNEDFAKSKGIPIESKDRPVITVNANGSVGEVFLRAERCIIHDDVKVIEVIDPDFVLDYVVFALRDAVQEGSYGYEAKLYNVKELAIKVPVDATGNPDLDRQNQIASAYKKFETLKQKLFEVGMWVASTRVKGIE